MPIGVPADDGARRLVMREARRAFDDEGMEGVVRVLRNNLGDEADNVLRELGLEEYIDDAVRAVCSFSGDTLVSTINGWEAISTLDEGDWVLAYDEATDTIGYYPVLATWVHEDPLIILLTIDGETIETTPEHPFRIAAGDWVAAGNLQAGDRIQQPDGAYGMVEVVDVVYRLQPMYNLTVAFAHTYFVGDGQWLVHNKCGVDYFLNALPSPGSQVKVSSGEISSEVMGELQRITADEFALFRMETGERVLVRGQRGRVEIPDGVTRLIAHTHPGLKLTPSYDDLQFLKELEQRFGQRSSYIISENGTMIEYDLSLLD